MTGNDSEDGKASSSEDGGDEDGPAAIRVEDSDDGTASSDSDESDGSTVVEHTPDPDRWLTKLDNLRAQWQRADNEERKRELRENFDNLSSKLRAEGVLDDDELPELGETHDEPEDTAGDESTEEDVPAGTDDSEVTPGIIEEDDTTEGAGSPEAGDSGGTAEPAETAAADDSEEAEEPTEARVDERDEAAVEVPDETGADERDEAAVEVPDETGAETTDPEAIRADLEEALDRIDDLEELVSEYRRKNEREHEMLEKEALEDLATRMLRVRETLERLIKHGDWDDESADQLHSLLRQFDQQLTAKSIAAIDPDRGDEVDYLRHQVETREEAEDIGPDRVLRVERKGYEISGFSTSSDEEETSGFPIRSAKVVATKRE